MGYERQETEDERQGMGDDGFIIVFILLVL